MDKIIDNKKFDLLFHIRSGSFGSYNIVKNIENGRLYYAKISLSKLYIDSNSVIDRKSRSFLESAERLFSFTSEVEIHSKLFHPAIIRFFGYSEKDFNNDNYPIIFTQYSINGTLRDILTKKRVKSKGWTNTKRFICVYGIAAAMAFLHSKNIIHFNLSPENVLIDSFLFPKIAEFASAQVGTPSRDKIRFDSFFYTAPEIYDEDIPINEKVDVYSFGIILNEIYTRKQPYDGVKNPFLLQSKIVGGSRPDLPTKSSLSEIKSLITRCWHENPQERPSFAEILKILNSDTFLKNKKMKINKDDFLSYVNYINGATKIYETDPNQAIIVSDYIKNKLRSEIREIDLGINPTEKRNRSAKRFSLKSKKPIFQEILETQNKLENETKVTRNVRENIIFPSSLYIKLDSQCQSIINEAESGDFNSIHSIVINLIYGKKGFPTDPELAILYLKEGIKLGDTKSMLFYGDMLIEGELIPQNYKAAVNLYRQVVQANDKNCLEGKVKLYQLQLSNDEEISVLFNEKINYEEIKSVSKEAADNGIVEGMLLYGYLCMKEKNDDEHGSITRNLDDAFKYLNSAVERESKEAMALYGKLISHGYGIQKSSKEESLELYCKSKELGSYSGEALYGYEKAKNKESSEEGLNLVVDSKEQGNSTGINAYGMIIFNGLCGFIADEERGVYYMKMAADEGNANAMYNYAQCLQKGRGIQQNIKEAIYYYKKSLEEGCLFSSLALSDLLNKKNNEFYDEKESKKYLKMANDYKITINNPNDINLVL